MQTSRAHRYLDTFSINCVARRGRALPLSCELTARGTPSSVPQLPAPPSPRPPRPPRPGGRRAQPGPWSAIRAERPGLRRHRGGRGLGRSGLRSPQPSGLPALPWPPVPPSPAPHSPEPPGLPSGPLTWAAAPAPAARAAPTAPRSGLNPRRQPIPARPGSPLPASHWLRSARS